MKFLIFSILFIGVVASAEERVKRQASYTFPGPRSDRSYRQSLSAAPVYLPEHDGETYPATRRQYQPQPQPQQPQYAAAQPRSPAQPAPVAAAPPPPSYEPAPRQAAPAPRAQSSPSSSRRRASSSAASSRANKYGSAPQQSLNGHDEEDEEEAGPDPLTLLLEDSQFTCGGKQDGYYADDSLNCQVFHYCVGGAKHSWMCPENTVFHQVHLNCVPDAQDICSQSQKFHFVNDYLYKPVDYEGPNKTARYSQRYYPDGYVVGDTLVAPQEGKRPAFQQAPQYHSESPPPPRQQPRQPAPPPPTYRAPQPQPAPQPKPQPRPQPRPSRPVESYPEEDPREYRPQAPPQAPPQSYRGGQPQPQRAQSPPPQAYRVAAAQQSQPSPHSGYTSSEESRYQPQPPPQSRRPEAPAPQRSAAAYAPPRQQYRQQAPSSRSGAGYQPYASNQAAGVEYDEDY